MMVNFEIEEIKKTLQVPSDMSDVEMSVSGYVGDGKDRHICVAFTRGREQVEISVPSYKITRKDGFSVDEIDLLLDYLRRNEAQIKEHASKINVMSAFMK